MNNPQLCYSLTLASTTFPIELQYHLFSLADYFGLRYCLRLEVLLSLLDRLNERIRLALVVFYRAQDVVILNDFRSDFVQEPWFAHQVGLQD